MLNNGLCKQTLKFSSAQISNLVCFLIFTILTGSCSTYKMANNYFVDYQKDSSILKYDTTFDKNFPQPEIVNGTVAIFFYGKYDDTLQIILNGTIRKTVLLSTNDSSYAHSYSGESFRVICKSREEIMTLRLLKAYRYIEFPVSKQYPLCKVDYVENTWHITNRKGYEIFEEYIRIM